VARPFWADQSIPIENCSTVSVVETEFGIVFPDRNAVTTDQLSEEAVDGLQVQWA
jgi:hypothetical protein